MNRFNQQFFIGKKKISASSPAFIVAEIGSNHNQSVRTAKKLIDVAAKAGVDAVKFQSLKFNQQYLEEKTSSSLKRLHQKIDFDDHLFVNLNKYCQKKGIIFLSSPTYLESLSLLKKINMAAYKIASPITIGFTNLIAAAAKIGKPLIVSTGYCDLPEIDRALKSISSTRNRNLVLLHCVSSYPTKYEEINLEYMKFLEKRYHCLVGYSDHSLSTSLPAVAVSLGARVIEKHFTLSRRSAGPDHYFALEPDELTEMVKNIRETEKALGNNRQLNAFEKKMKKIVMMKLVAANDLNAGTILKKSDFIFRRAQGGIEEYRLKDLVGTKLVSPIKKMKLVEWRNIIKK